MFPMGRIQHKPYTLGYIIIAQIVLVSLLFLSGCNPVSSAPARYRLTPDVNILEWGTVEVSPAPDKDGLYASGTEVTLTAVPAKTFKFFFWLGDKSGSRNPLMVVMDSNKVITAMFNYELGNAHSETINVAAGSIASRQVYLDNGDRVEGRIKVESAINEFKFSVINPEQTVIKAKTLLSDSYTFAFEGEKQGVYDLRVDNTASSTPISISLDFTGFYRTGWMLREYESRLEQK